MNAIKKFNEETKLLHIKFEQTDRLPTLYHYRSKASIPLIIANSELRFSHYKYLQHKTDKEEIELGHDEILKLISNMINTSKYSLFWEKFYRDFFNLKQYQSIYILSFSTERDDPKLWQRYYQGTGASLAFNFKVSQVTTPPYFHCLKVFYDQQIEEFTYRINSFLHLADNYLTYIKQDGEGLRSFAIELGCQILPYLPVRKRQTFDFEKEYRLVIPGMIVDGKGYPEEINKEFFKENDMTGLESPIAYKFEPDELTEILIGPCATQEFEDSVKNVINGYDKKIPVNQSKVVFPCN